MESSVFLDSGAFSAMTSGTTLDVYAYIEYVQSNLPYLDVYANLDVIGNAEATWKNQEIMEAHGLNPLPVYHVGEDIKYLHRAMNYEYFAIGGMARSASSNLRPQVDLLFSHICPKSNNYFPLCKVHGFGCTNPSFIIQYPWYSVDSSSWVKYGLYGMVIVPKFVHNKPIYNKSPSIITISSRSKSISEAVHFNNMSKMEQQVVINYFAERGFNLGESEIIEVEPGYKLQEFEAWYNKEKTKIEFTAIPGLSNNHVMRDNANIQYFLELEKQQPEWPWAWKKVRSQYLF